MLLVVMAVMFMVMVLFFAEFHVHGDLHLDTMVFVAKGNGLLIG